MCSLAGRGTALFPFMFSPEACERSASCSLPCLPLAATLQCLSCVSTETEKSIIATKCLTNIFISYWVNTYEWVCGKFSLEFSSIHFEVFSKYHIVGLKVRCYHFASYSLLESNFMRGILNDGHRYIFCTYLQKKFCCSIVD